ncbi:YlxR family protein [Mariprofundus ferrooxydans]|uniref:Ribosomal protein L7Ae family protein n=1 Tax=Mariprofundus ferrooxydans PV-1 TaxID=314345 RepID=Q0EZ73_9PROT|nr:YlxR family protein [Mariprofundus ferrooxydans]EAU54551.1 ribosomal protein L7Ae family protein [Mariprofundus ferrooxydans PV-1]KON48837.1 ribosomal protein L7Ae family protein [Mariprofundus ferrooxydans]
MTESGHPERRCIICRASQPAEQMLRLIVDEDGQIWPDLLHKLPGRGAWHCMSEACLAATNDKRLQVLKRDFSVALPQWNVLSGRITHVLDAQLERMFTRIRRGVATGRDAVMHRLWNNAPVMLLLAGDAGDALTRQVQDAAEKRKQAGHGYTLVLVSDRDWLGRMLGREQVAVAALDSSALAEKLKQYCVWFGRMKVSG